MWKLPFKTIAVVGALSIGALALADPADARSRHRHHNHGGAVAAAIAGLAIGAIIAETTSRRNSRYYNDRYYDDRRYYAPPPPPRHYRAAPPRRNYSYGSPKPWTPAWYSYCTSKYRSFDPRSGTFQPYHGPRRMCR